LTCIYLDYQNIIWRRGGKYLRAEESGGQQPSICLASWRRMGVGKCRLLFAIF